MKIAKLTNKAEQDLESIFDYTVHQWGFLQADRYLSDIEERISALVQNPTLGRSLRNIPESLLKSSVGKHLIIYRVEDYGILVLRILHQMMDTERHI